jgi:hypothetical protein
MFIKVKTIFAAASIWSIMELFFLNISSVV